MLSEIDLKAKINKFCRAKCIDTLALFLLEYYLNKDKVKAKLIKCSQQFISFKGTHYL